ncbi:MAG: hypothetical protein RIC93_04290 [Alphaproteobacteria bacterium]
MRNIAIGFSAGALGAVANVAFVWLSIQYRLTDLLSLSLSSPPPLPEFLYRQVAWGGLWGIALVLPVLERSVILRGLLLGALASAAALFYFFPLHTNAMGHGPGLLGQNIGTWMPLFVLIANSVWGLVAAWFYRQAR